MLLNMSRATTIVNYLVERLFAVERTLNVAGNLWMARDSAVRPTACGYFDTSDGPACHPQRPPVSHLRARYIALMLATIAVGLLVHLRGEVFGQAARDVLGDALWAAMIVWCVGALSPGMRLLARSGVAYGVCAAVEVSQLYHAPTLDAIRATAAGHLVLGSGFDPRDLAAYALGVAAAALLDAALGISRQNH